MSVLRRAHGPTVRAIRQALDKPSEDVADAAGISRSYLTNIEKGRRRPESDVSARIADALGVEVEYLTGQKPAIGIIRAALRIEPVALARDVGISSGRLERIERGTELPDPDLVRIIARRLGVTLAALDADTEPLAGV